MKTTTLAISALPLSVTLSADLLTPVSVFLRVSEGENQAFLFESVEAGERLDRYSYIGIRPFETLTIQDGVFRTESRTLSSETRENPFQALGQALTRYSRLEKNLSDVELPPFTGGAVGYMGYETVHYLERIEKAKLAGVPSHEAYLMVFRTIIAFDHVRKELKIISNLFSSSDEATEREIAEKEISLIKQKLSQPSPKERPFLNEIDSSLELKANDMECSLGRENFLKAVIKIKNHIQQGDVFQCVVSEQFCIDLNSSPFDLYRALRVVSPSPYLFFLKMGEEVLLGASPEMLTRVRDGLVETCPIAGTRPRGKTQADDKKYEKLLLESTKERAEHLMLVDLSRNDVGRVAAPGTVEVTQFMKVERFSHVMHLVSHVQGRLDQNQSAWDAFTSCFPAGTLTGAPKIRAMQLISELETHKRGTYGGAVIYFDFSGKLDSCIAIRSVYCRNGKAHLQAGAGIVADSIPEMEYQEVLEKTRSVRKALALALTQGELK